MDKHSAKNSGTRVPFETLIRGEYREDFQKKVEEILRLTEEYDASSGGETIRRIQQIAGEILDV